MKPEREFRVALCGYYGFGNLGDELLAEGLLAALEGCGIRRGEIAMLSASPEESERAHGVRSVSRWSPRAVFQILRRSETLLLGGGGLFQDVTSLRSPFYYWGVIRLALLAGARPWCAGQSVGPFLTKSGTLLARSALGSCSVRGVRDCRSAALLAEWGADSVVTCDPVFSLALPVAPPRRGSSLLVNIRPWTGDLARRTAEESARLASARSLSLAGFALSAEDAEVMEGLRRNGVFPAERIVLLGAGNWRNECTRLFPEADGVVAMRFHASILALLFGRPLTAVVYDPKVESLASEWALPSWSGSGALPEPSPPMRRIGPSEAGAEFLETFSEMCAAAVRRDGKE